MEFKAHVYQKRAIDAIKENTPVGLFLDMGLGKTVSTLTAINDLKYDYFEINKVLVIAPKKVAEVTWSDEIEKWDHLKHLTISKVLGPAKKRLKALEVDADIYIVNRENVVWLIEQYGKYTNREKKTGFKFIKDWPFDLVVIDELSSFKNSSSKRFKMLKKATPLFKRVVGLTGTPAPNGLLDLWSQLYILDRGERLGSTYTGYRNRYFEASDMIRTPGGKLIETNYKPRTGAENAIYSAIDDICISMKSEDWLDMPEKVINKITVELSDKDRKKYRDLERDFVLELDGEVIDAASASSLSMKLHQLTQGAIYTDESSTNWEEIHVSKLEALSEIIDTNVDKPILVFYWFKHDLERLRKKFPNSRELMSENDIKDWNNGNIDILLVHPASAGHGLNLQSGGNVIVWFSLIWSLELYQQANARLYRQGQKNESVIIHHLITKNTVDERIMDVLEGKATKQEALMDAVKARIDEYLRR